MISSSSRSAFSALASVAATSSARRINNVGASTIALASIRVADHHMARIALARKMSSQSENVCDDAKSNTVSFKDMKAPPFIPPFASPKSRVGADYGESDGDSHFSSTSAISTFWAQLRDPNSKISESSLAANNVNVNEFRSAVERGHRNSAWSMYNALMATNPKFLTIEDHLRMMSFFYDAVGVRPYQRFHSVYMNLYNQKFDIPMPVYESICSRAVTVEPANVFEYYKHALARFGSDMMLPVSIHASVMNAYRRSDTPIRALEHIDRVHSEGYDIHGLKPIAMDVCLRVGDEVKAKAYFDSYVQNERRPASLARIYGWLAMALQRRGRLSEATAVLDALTERGIVESPTGLAVRIRIAISEGDRETALNIVRQRFLQARRTPRSDDAAYLLFAFLKSGEIQKAKDLLSFYDEQFKNFPYLRYDPYFPMMHYECEKEKSFKPAIEIFNNIPSNDKYRSLTCLRQVCRHIIRLGTEKDAFNFLKCTMAHGLPMNDVECGCFIEEVKKEVKEGQTFDREIENVHKEADALNQ